MEIDKINTNKVKSDVFNMDCVEYMLTLPDNFFDIAICDPPYGDADSGDFQFGENTSTSNRLRFHGGDRWERYYKPTGIHTQGGTWSKKYYKDKDGDLKNIDWDVAPQQEFFDELFRVSKNQVIWGWELFLPSTYKMLSRMEKTIYFREVLHGNV